MLEWNHALQHARHTDAHSHPTPKSSSSPFLHHEQQTGHSSSCWSSRHSNVHAPEEPRNNAKTGLLSLFVSRPRETEQYPLLMPPCFDFSLASGHALVLIFQVPLQLPHMPDIRRSRSKYSLSTRLPHILLKCWLLALLLHQMSEGHCRRHTKLFA